MLTRSCEVSHPTCVEQDILQCGEDVAWALAWTTVADDPEGLDRLARAYEAVAATGHLRLAPPGAPPIDVAVPEPARSQAAYVYPLALVTARRGQIAEARRALEALARRGPLDPTSSELLARLEAARGDLPEAPSAEPTSELPVVLAALEVALSDPAADPRDALAASALGFGPAAPLPPGLDEANRAALVALRALSTFEDVDGSVQASLSRADAPAYDALVQLARRREAARRLDAELAAMD